MKIFEENKLDSIFVILVTKQCCEVTLQHCLATKATKMSSSLFYSTLLILG